MIHSLNDRFSLDFIVIDYNFFVRVRQLLWAKVFGINSTYYHFIMVSGSNNIQIANYVYFVCE